MKAEEIWAHIHSERAQMAETWAALASPQWAAASWCQGWSVQDTAGHIVAAAEQTPVNFYKEMTSAGFRFSVFADRGARRMASPFSTAGVGASSTRTSRHEGGAGVAVVGRAAGPSMTSSATA